ncbi:MAG: hybrid sensor histidine kinase/response regulator [Candidatus Ozemobacteraceae bacterium]
MSLLKIGVQVVYCAAENLNRRALKASVEIHLQKAPHPCKLPDKHPVVETQPRKIILVVDDVEDNIGILGGILRQQYEVRVALSGTKALKIAESDMPPDLILLDIMMPEMDGYEVCRRLKDNPKTRRIPVIFVSAKNEDIDEEKGLEIGAVDYLSKPVRPVIVKARVKNHLNLAIAARELEKQNEILQENLLLREEIEQIYKHDLKNPLSVFFTVSDLMERAENLTPRQREYLGALDRSAHKMLEMINRSLDLAKMERGTYKLDVAPVDVLKTIRHLLDQFSEQVVEKKLQVKFRVRGNDVVPDDQFIIPGEEYLYYSLFSNLIKNAVEASPKKQVLEISLNEGCICSVEIKNQGEIPSQIRERFFEKYATFGKKSGTGLGAYSARLMARTLGGDLRFSTSHELGTCLIFDIPQAT